MNAFLVISWVILIAISSTFEEASVFDDLGKVMRARVKAHDDNFASLRKTTKVVLQDISESGAGIHRLFLFICVTQL